MVLRSLRVSPFNRRFHCTHSGSSTRRFVCRCGLRPHPAAHLSIALSSVRLIDGRTNKSLALCIILIPCLIPCEIPCVPCPCMPCVCRVVVRCRAVGRVLLLSLVPASINQTMAPRSREQLHAAAAPPTDATAKSKLGPPDGHTHRKNISSFWYFFSAYLPVCIFISIYVLHQLC